MPTKKPRLTVTLDPGTYEVFKQFSSAQGRSMGSVINEVLTEASPSVSRVTSFLIRANNLSDTAIRSIAADLDEASLSIEAVYEDNQRGVDAMIARVVAAGRGRS